MIGSGRQGEDLIQAAVGEQLHAFAAELYPICRSITGDGVRETLRLVRRHVPLMVHEIRSGTHVFDWEVPLEWNIEAAWIRDPDGKPVVDFRDHNLHVVSYSEPLRASLSLDQLKAHLHASEAHPDWIPYRTSYYRRNWGFCLRHRDLLPLRTGTYDVCVQSSLEPGSLTYGEAVIRGRTRDEVLLFTHVCHPSLANDNASGIAIATWLARWLAAEPRRFTYRIVFAPGTIGSLTWLSRNERNLARVKHGLVLGLLGDPGPLTYKESRNGTADIDAIASYVLRGLDEPGRVIPFEPYGYDERQLCSPGFDLPVGRLTRSVNDGYAEYHSSADNLELVRPDRLAGSLQAIQQIVRTIEGNAKYRNLSPKGEPRLGKRGLYGAVGGQSPAKREHALLWVLNQSDGGKSLLDIASRSGIEFDAVRTAATELAGAGLLREAVRTVSKATGAVGGKRRSKTGKPRAKSARERKAGKRK